MARDSNRHSRIGCGRSHGAGSVGAVQPLIGRPSLNIAVVAADAYEVPTGQVKLECEPLHTVRMLFRDRPSGRVREIWIFHQNHVDEFWTRNKAPLSVTTRPGGPGIRRLLGTSDRPRQGE